jgi:hypothetical protein
MGTLLLVRMSIGIALKALKIGLPYDLAMPLLGIYTKEMKSIYWRHVCTPILHNNQDMPSN